MRWDIENFHWGPGLFLIIYHSLLLVLLPTYIFIMGAPYWGLLLLAFILFFLTGMSITAGYHRYYAHKAYTPSKPVEAVLLFFATLSAEGSVLDWAHDHRLHHRHVDTEKDPYNIEKGFWHAHFIWIFEKRERDYKKVVRELMDNKMVMFQHRYYGTLVILTNALVVGLAWWWFNDLFGAIVWVFLARMFLLHHATWFINSLAHTWGAKPYSKEQSAVNNFVIALLTFGEGYHNYHHTFSGDYRNGIKWWQFDPAKLLIKMLQKVGLAKNLHQIDDEIIQKKLITEDKKLLLQKIRELDYVNKKVMKRKIDEMYISLADKIKKANTAAKDYRKAKAEQRKAMKQKRKEYRKALKKEWKRWSTFTNNVLKMQRLA